MVSTQPFTKSLALKVHRIERKYKVMSNNTRALIADHQAKIKGLAATVKNKGKKINQKIINKKFAENPRKVYREFKDENIEVKDPPEKEELENFWRPLYEQEKQHTEGDWINLIKDKNKDKPKMTGPYIDASVIKKKDHTVRKFQNTRHRQSTQFLDQKARLIVPPLCKLLQ